MSRQYRRRHRIFSLVAIFFLRLYTAITGRARVRVLLMNKHGEVLLIKGTVSHGDWSLPGGGIKRHEQPVVAARRELFEETGIDIPESQLRFVRTFKKADLSLSFDAPLFHAVADRAALPDKLYNPLEIIAAEWFPVDHLPEPLSAVTKAAITEIPHL